MKYAFAIVLWFTAGFLAVRAQQTTTDSVLLDDYQNQRFAEAADYLKKIFPEPVTDKKALSGLAYASMMAGRLPEAENYYQRLYQSDTGNTAILFQLGSVYSRQGNDTMAIRYYHKILEADSNNFSVLKQMAILSRQTGDAKAALRYLREADSLRPADPDVAYDLAAYYINTRQYPKADLALTPAIQADTANMLLLRCRAQVYFGRENFKATAAVCDKLIGAGEMSDDIVNMLGTSDYYLVDFKGCISAYKIMEQNKTAGESAYYYIAMSYKALDSLTITVLYLDKAIKTALSGNVNSYYGELADTYESLHRSRAAINAYRQSLLYGAMPLTYYALADIYDKKLKNKFLSLVYYRKYLASHPPVKQLAYIQYAKRRIRELSR